MNRLAFAACHEWHGMQAMHHAALILPARDTAVITKTQDLRHMGGAACYEWDGMTGIP
jgi:hypothetical protein